MQANILRPVSFCLSDLLGVSLSLVAPFDGGLTQPEAEAIHVTFRVHGSRAAINRLPHF